MINIKLFYSTILIVTLVSFVIFSYRLYEKDSWNHKPFKYLAWDVVVNIIPCLSCSPILIGWIIITQKSIYIVNNLCAYTEINGSNAGNQIGLEINIYTQINEYSASKKIRLETNIYTEINASSASNQIGLEINIYTGINPFSAINQIWL